METISNSIMSGIIGFTIGDALGVPVEFLDRNTLDKKPIKDMLGYGSHNVPAGTWSDDTSLMLATIDSISERKGIDYDDIMYKFLEWYRDAKYTATEKVFDIGVSTRSAIHNYYINNKNPLECGSKGIRENGNGSLMRILPIVFYSYCNDFDEISEIDLINNASSLTHAHEISRLGCKIFSDYVKCLLTGVDKFNSLGFVEKKQYQNHYSQESVNLYQRILSGQITTLGVKNIKSTGFVVDTLEACIWCILNTNNFEDAVTSAVNLGDDTDTVGALTGALAGIIYGKNQIPSRWVSALRKHDYIVNKAESFSNSLNPKIENSKHVE